jgi:hypothetical protein
MTKFQIPIDDQIAELKAELALRRNVYGNWIRSNRMKKEAGDRRFARMTAALHTLMELQETERGRETGFGLNPGGCHICRTRFEDGLPD